MALIDWRTINRRRGIFMSVSVKTRCIMKSRYCVTRLWLCRTWLYARLKFSPKINELNFWFGRFYFQFLAPDKSKKRKVGQSNTAVLQWILLHFRTSLLLLSCIMLLLLLCQPLPIYTNKLGQNNRITFQLNGVQFNKSTIWYILQNNLSTPLEESSSKNRTLETHWRSKVLQHCGIRPQ